MATGGKVGLFRAALSWLKRPHAQTRRGVAVVDNPAPRRFVEYRGRPMPWVKSVMPDYAGESRGLSKRYPGQRVRYITDPQERELYRLHIGDDQRLYWGGKPLDTTDIRTARSEGRCIFVMDPYGRFYASKWQAPGQFHHSSLLAGWPAAAAGEMRVVNGRLEHLNDWSGHYAPWGRNTAQALQVLNRLGIDTSRVRVEYAARYW